jgi:tetratricopeptide (TPR) repeat protein
MKSARRHELEHNQLAVWLAAKAETIKPHLKTAGAAILAVALAWLVYSFVTGRSQQRLAEGWEKYYQANDLKEYQAVADEFENSPAGLAARQQLALMQLGDGNRRLMLDREAGMILLEGAAKNFETVIRESNDPMVKQHAMYQLGRAYESMGQLENAKTEYEKLTKNWPDSAYASAAKGRLEDLEKPATKEFYDWYKTARMQSLTERIGGSKLGDALKEEPTSPDPLALPDPPERKDVIGPDVKQPENNAPAEKQAEDKKSEEKSADPKASSPKPADEKSTPAPKSSDSPKAKST